MSLLPWDDAVTLCTWFEITAYLQAIHTDFSWLSSVSTVDLRNNIFKLAITTAFQTLTYSQLMSIFPSFSKGLW
jgi:hypothetical protein